MKHATVSKRPRRRGTPRADSRPLVAPEAADALVGLAPFAAACAAMHLISWLHCAGMVSW